MTGSPPAGDHMFSAFGSMVRMAASSLAMNTLSSFSPTTIERSFNRSFSAISPPSNPKTIENDKLRQFLVVVANPPFSLSKWDSGFLSNVANENDKKKEAKRNEDEKNKAIILKNQLEKEKLTLTVKVGDNGKLFGAITNKEIAGELENKFGLKIDKKKIECSIKALGEHKVTIKLHQDVKAEITVITKE